MGIIRFLLTGFEVLVPQTFPSPAPKIKARMSTCKEVSVPDDKSKRGAQDRSRINVNEDYELSYWSKKLSVTQDELKAAVKAVGDCADSVEQHLKAKAQPAHH